MSGHDASDSEQAKQKQIKQKEEIATLCVL